MADKIKYNKNAPKDPQKNRPFFYIIRDKEIYGADEGGKGIHYIYEDSGRLVNSARITGGIENEDMLELLKTARGLKTLVHSIGVSLDTPDVQSAEFVFQIYKKTDRYAGTQLCINVDGDSLENRIYLSDYEPLEDDYEPGQIKLIFPNPGIEGRLDVKFYLNDGFEAPAVIEEEVVDRESKEYNSMIERTLLSTGNTQRLQKAIQKAASSRVSLAYIGGSITQGAGAIPIHTNCYARQSFELFKDRFCKEHGAELIKAGVGGTPSKLGMIRFDRDVLRGKNKPDIIIIEFAVNDADDDTKGDCYESLVRKVLNLEWKPAVVLLFSVFADDWNLEERLIPIGEHYQLPMVSIKQGICPEFAQKEKRLMTRNQFFYDAFHPTNLGHRMMADALYHLFEKVGMLAEADRGFDAYEDSEVYRESELRMQELLLLPPVVGKSFEYIKLLDEQDNDEGVKISIGSFQDTDGELQSVEMDESLERIPQFPYNWHYKGSGYGKPFEMEICCKALVLVFKDSGEADFGSADIYVDGRYILRADPHINNWLHCNSMILLNEDEARMHHLKIEISEEYRNKKFTILGFGYVI